METIGTATLKKGVLTLHLRATGRGPRVGDALITYHPGDAHYAKVLEHCSPIADGETRLIPPFPAEK